MPMTIKEIDHKLRIALKFKDRTRKIAYIMGVAQLIAAEAQLEQLELPREALAEELKKD